MSSSELVPTLSDGTIADRIAVTDAGADELSVAGAIGELTDRLDKESTVHSAVVAAAVADAAIAIATVAAEDAATAAADAQVAAELAAADD